MNARRALPAMISSTASSVPPTTNSWPRRRRETPAYRRHRGNRGRRVIARRRGRRIRGGERSRSRRARPCRGSSDPERGMAPAAPQLAQERFLAIGAERMTVAQSRSGRDRHRRQQDRGHVGADCSRNVRTCEPSTELAGTWRGPWRAAPACRIIRGPFFPDRPRIRHRASTWHSSFTP